MYQRRRSEQEKPLANFRYKAESHVTFKNDVMGERSIPRDLIYFLSYFLSSVHPVLVLLQSTAIC